MINLVYGANGSGKTQKLIDLANSEIEKTKGLIVYLDRSNNHRLAVDKQIRFINTDELGIGNTDTFIGLLTGLIAGNYDINRIYIDNLHKIIGSTDSADITEVLKKINKLNDLNDIVFYTVINSEDVSEDLLKDYQLV